MDCTNIEFVVTDERDIEEATRLSCQHGIKTMYVPSEQVRFAALCRQMVGSKHKIYALVDWPKGDIRGTNKFQGTKTDFFFADGYDVILSPITNESDIILEVKNIHTFIRGMISNIADICFTVNVSSRNDDDLKILAKTFREHQPSRIKLESLTKLQPSKANIKTHEYFINLLGGICKIPIIICGNIDVNIYKQLKLHKMAVSVEQFKGLKNELA